MAVRLYKVRRLYSNTPKVKKAFKRWMNRWMRREGKLRGPEAPVRRQFKGYAD